MKKLRLSAVFIGASLLLASCGSSQSSASTENRIDIKDMYLTNMSGDCADYSSIYGADVQDLGEKKSFQAAISLSRNGKSCEVKSNDIPNYDFNDGTGRFRDPVAVQNISLSIPRNPKVAKEPKSLSLLFYNAVMLNGVVVDLLSNGCYKPNDKKADPNGNVADGCGLSVDWRLDPMGKFNFGTDSHNAHTQPGGLYHYHGNPMALYDPKETEMGSPVIGFAADGFPIYGPHYVDPKSKKMLVAKSGYTLKKGFRPNTEESPGGKYDGTYIQDYEFTNTGTLDQCNGMTVNGQYGYYITESYPYILGCLSGEQDLSFFKFWHYVKLAVTAVSGLLILVIAVIAFRIRKKRSCLGEKGNTFQSGL